MYKKLAILGIIFVAILFFSVSVFANDRREFRGHENKNHSKDNFNPDKQLSKSACGDKLGKPVIDVVQKVQNDSDSGVAGNYWAFDYFTRNIKVWPTGTWDVTGAYTFDTKYLGGDYSYTVTLSQSGNTITGNLYDSYLPGNLTISNGSLSGSTITFSVDYGSGSSQGTRTFTGTIDSSGNMSGTWSETGLEAGHDTWSTTEGKVKGNNSYCAIVTYDGKFYAVPGQAGPGSASLAGPLIDTSTNQPVNGDFRGGYRATFNGTLTVGPWPTNGNVGTTNYKCNIAGTCPEAIDWVGQYFPGYTNFDQPWWGWRYDGGSHGTWINASTGNSGNIL
jgi:hypothetical protein